MVGVNHGGKDSILARASIVNQFGHCIYDKYVKPTDKVTDYRTEVSGIRPQDIKDGEDFKKVKKEISDILKGRILVGHSVHHDLKVLYIKHPKEMTRDTSSYKPFMCGSCHIWNVLIGVEYWNCRQTLDVYLLFAI